MLLTDLHRTRFKTFYGLIRNDPARFGNKFRNGSDSLGLDSYAKGIGFLIAYMYNFFSSLNENNKFFLYYAGIHAPTLSTSGHSLPLARRLSYIFSPDIPIPDKQFTLAAMQYGQIITHDMAMIDGSTQSSKFCIKLRKSRKQCIPKHNL